ncbi:P-loop containing nucleoside triphosphate hydrolase protein [Rickenella mellea]|uniref:P-loop containing nucleoside triphosphate hydrolase protein n=1 Tax=Rickenella mellea TaxID=50990 RepID=A0A4Y7PSK4_9AGAM|nr:P-loop containing nucleoside triphosphate hydrolase protein [Rickenella mellea]
MSGSPSGRNITATTLAAYYHFQCDLFLHRSYHSFDGGKPRAQPSELSKAQFERGGGWESSLLKWLDDEGLLLNVLSGLLEGSDIQEMIELDDRHHFFITGLSFWAPQAALAKEFKGRGQQPVRFGIAKPDLIEIKKTHDGNIWWQVIDAKSSKAVKTSHHVQIYLYHLFLQQLLPLPRYTPAETASVWLTPSPGDSPSLDGLKPIAISLLSLPLDDFMFRKLPAMLALSPESVKWHFNPLCNGCPYEKICSTDAVRHGKLGAMANINIQDAQLLQNVLGLTRTTSSDHLTDIEDLDQLLNSSKRLDKLHDLYPSTVRKVQRILKLPTRKSKDMPKSALVMAAKTKTTQVINRRNFTLPNSEDITVTISIVHDPSISEIGTWCISVFSNFEVFKHPEPLHGSSGQLIPQLASILRTILELRSSAGNRPRTQCYVFAPAERAALQSHLINAALTSSRSDEDLQSSIRLCIGALCDGAALLSTAFQPVILSGALLDFLGKRGDKTKTQLQGCLDRLGLPQEGNIEELRLRIQAEVNRIKTEGGRLQIQSTDGNCEDGRRELGQLPRVVAVKLEVERLLALPIPGYWDLPLCFTSLIGNMRANICPSEEDIFSAYRGGREDDVTSMLTTRNQCVLEIIRDVRRRVSTDPTSTNSLLVNQARVLSANFMDICREDYLRKLFFMQQFEVLTKLAELWQARIDGCPDAPLLEYQFTNRTVDGGYIHSFTLLSGAIDLPSDKERSFFDFILTEDKVLPAAENQFGVPVESLFDDLSVANLVFPLNKYTMSKWTSQATAVQNELFVTDIQDLIIQGNHTKVTLRTWGSFELRLGRGKRYRLSPRLVDFNIGKVLNTLVELDLQVPSDPSPSELPPFLQLFSDPHGFAQQSHKDDNTVSEYLKAEALIHRSLRELWSLGSTEAGSLTLKQSQRRATRRILSSRLTVIWGPPGTGKTYTISLSLLRLIQVRHRCKMQEPQIIFVTAMTHAAIEAVLSKLRRLVGNHQIIPNLDIAWLQSVKIEHVAKGVEHSRPDGIHTYIYAGTVYQLFNFSKRSKLEVDCAVIDEAGQLGLGAASLVLRSLRSGGKVVVAGDSEQLAPILTAQYPRLDSRLFGSILDCLMYTAVQPNAQDGMRPPSPAFSETSEISTIVQLTENFRLNPDLGNFVSTIYSKAFQPQKGQARKVATQLKQLQLQGHEGAIEKDACNFLLDLANAMLRSSQARLRPPRMIDLTSNNTEDPNKMPRPISLALVRLIATSIRQDQIGYETHVRGEAAFGAALVRFIQRASPSETIFVATPHRIQRHAVKEALKSSVDDLSSALGDLEIDKNEISPARGKVTVDTIERLQGSEAAFVICLFSHTHTSSATSALDFLLQRRRLNVAISRAQTLCIVVTSDGVLHPPVRVLANAESAKGLAFLRAFEERAWSTDVIIDLDALA